MKTALGKSIKRKRDLPQYLTLKWAHLQMDGNINLHQLTKKNGTHDTYFFAKFLRINSYLQKMNLKLIIVSLYTCLILMRCNMR